VAVLAMIQGHTFAALLRDDALSAGVSWLHALLHGLTAPAFLLGAGLAFGMATYGEYQRHRSMNSTTHKRLGRYLMLFVLGYLLQVPGGSIASAFSAQGEQLRLLCRVGPLQLIAITLGLCQLAILLVERPIKHAVWAVAAGVVVLVGATPVAHSGLAAELGAFLGAWFDDRGGAHFPLLPWSSFVLLGLGGGALLQRGAACAVIAGARTHERRRALPLIVAGSTAAALGYAQFKAAAVQQGAMFLWRSSPGYFVFRLGLVAMIFGLLHLPAEERGLREDGASTGRSWSAVLARQSLVAYVAHLFVLYGTPFTPGLNRLGKALGLAQASLACGGVLAASLCATQLWDRWEREPSWLPGHPRSADSG
jgi:uncharacterized membrane protein